MIDAGISRAFKSVKNRGMRKKVRGAKREQQAKRIQMQQGYIVQAKGTTIQHVQCNQKKEEKIKNSNATATLQSSENCTVLYSTSL